MKRFLIATAGTVALFAASAVHAEPITIDFSGHTDGSAVGDTYAAEGVTFTDAIFGTCGGGCPTADGSGNFAFSGASADAFSAAFSTAQTSISFQSVSFSSTLATAYNSTGSVVASTSDEQAFPTTDQTDTLTGAGITSVVFSYNGGFNGPAITNLSFEQASVSAAPEPGTWALMIFGVAGLGLTLRRRRGMADEGLSAV